MSKSNPTTADGYTQKRNGTCGSAAQYQLLRWFFGTGLLFHTEQAHASGRRDVVAFRRPLMQVLDCYNWRKVFEIGGYS